MLYILFGTTAEMGLWSRNYFHHQGIELIHKISYVPNNFALKARFGDRLKTSKEAVLNCDFVYENNGMYVGFNKGNHRTTGREQAVVPSDTEKNDENSAIIC